MSKKFDELYESILTEGKVSYDAIDKLPNGGSMVIGKNSEGDVYAWKDSNVRLYIGNTVKDYSGDYVQIGKLQPRKNLGETEDNYMVEMYENGKLIDVTKSMNKSIITRIKNWLGGGESDGVKVDTGIFGKGTVWIRGEDKFFKFIKKHFEMK